MYMKTLIIVAHPDLASSRINQAWVKELQRHDHITVHDLYRQYPSGNIDAGHEQLLLEQHDRIIFQFPLYWYSSPPLLKGWYDTVLQAGFAYGPDGSKLQGKQMGAAVSTYGTAESYQSYGANRFTIEELLRPLEALARYVGADYLPPYSLHDASHVTEEQLEQSQLQYLQYVQAPAAQAEGQRVFS
jgi:putative NADPH-quinone reductase